MTTEIPITAAIPPVSAAPIAAPTPPPSAAEQSVTPGIEPCPHCGTPLALDQRYCLECGAPRTYLSGMLLERLRSPAGQTFNQPPQPPGPGGPVEALASQISPGSSAWQRGNALTLIASIGVLLLAMGVGVLIGRSGGSSAAGAAAPQIVTVPAVATGAASTTATPTTPGEEGAAAKAAAAAAGAAGGGAKHKAKDSGVGATPSKPAPPTVLKNLRTGSGGNYEQKSKNLPNVVSTG
jgi:zinc-ribbon domain